jgi:hypothetical protein
VSTPTPAAPVEEIHLVVRLSNEFGNSDEICGALTSDSEALRLMRVCEGFAGDDGAALEIRTVPIHTSAAAVLGLA